MLAFTNSDIVYCDIKMCCMFLCDKKDLLFSLVEVGRRGREFLLHIIKKKKKKREKNRC